MGLFWKYADVTGAGPAVCVACWSAHVLMQALTVGNQRWKGFTWGMMPLLGGALCACTYHAFYNSLDVLVVLQAFLTVVGNFTLWFAAWRVFQTSVETTSP